MSTTIWSREGIKERCSLSSLFPFITILIALLMGVGMILSEPFLVIGALAMILILLSRQYELAAVLVLLTSLYLDWYLDHRVVALVLTLILLIVFFLDRSSQRPWAE